MKKLLIGILALSSFAVYSQEGKELIIENITYPEKTMTLKCLDAGCTLISKDNKYVLDMADIDATIKNRSGYRNDEVQFSHAKKTASNIRVNLREGYNGKVVGNSVLFVGASVLDTALAIPKGVVQLLTPRIDSMKDKKAAKRLKSNLLSDQGIMQIKHKYFEEIRNYIKNSGAGTSTTNIDETYKKFLSVNNFRCQLSEYSPTCETGRYGIYVVAVDKNEAVKKCNEVAKRHSAIYCKTTNANFRDYVGEIGKFY